MTDDTRRGRVARLRELQTRFTADCLSMAWEPQPTEVLYQCGQLLDHSLERDIQAWTSSHAPLFESLGVPTGLLAVRLRTLHDEVSGAAAMDAAREAEHIVLTDCADWPARAVDAAKEAYQRCVYWAWCAGDERAAFHVARVASELARTATNDLARTLCEATMWDAIRNPCPAYGNGGAARARGHETSLTELAEGGLRAEDLLLARAHLAGEERRREKEAQGRALKKLLGDAVKDLLDNPIGGVQADILQVLPDDIEVEELAPRGRVVFPALEPATVTPDGRRTGAPAVIRSRVGHVAGRVLRYDAPANPKAFRDTMLSEFPYAEEAVDAMAQDLVVAQQLGYAWLRNTLLVGHPGLGKTRFARRAAEAAGLRHMLHSMAGHADGALAGTSAQWASARLSAPAQAVLQFECANPCLVLDEADKAGTSTHNGNAQDAAIPFMERETSRRIVDPMLELPLDLSCLTYLLTANDLSKVSGPLRDRLRVLHIPKPRPEHLPAIARTMVADLREENGVTDAWMPDLDGDELGLLASQWKGGSMRRLRRLVEVLVLGREALAPRH